MRCETQKKLRRIGAGHDTQFDNIIQYKRVKKKLTLILITKLPFSNFIHQHGYV